MQVTETSVDGLKRELQVVVNAGELGEQLTSRLEELKQQVRIKGFRPGKVPVAHLRRIYGRQVMAEVLEKAISESSEQAIGDRGERPAHQPNVKLSEDEEEIERVMKGEADLAYTLSFEILPEFEVANLAEIKLERPFAKVPESEIEKTIDGLLDGGITYEASAERRAEDGDQVKVDFIGRVDGEEFEGGSAEDIAVVLGKGGFIPGFEDGLVGVAAGNQVEIKSTFPEDYPVESLAGKEAVFETVVKEVGVPKRPELDDAFAESIGFENVDGVRQAVEQQIRTEFDRASRDKLKRALLDALDETHAFELPPSLVDDEFNGLWQQAVDGLERAGTTFEEEGKSEDEVRAEYRSLAERRVRLGLVISEIGAKNDIDVTEEEMARAMATEVRRYPGREQEVYELMRSRPEALARLRAPIFEEKVVDFILELADVSDHEITTDELFAPDEDEIGESKMAPEPAEATADEAEA